MKALALALIVMAAPCFGHNAAQALPGRMDPRLQTVPYDPDRVVVLRGRPGFQLMLEFSPDERIENVSIGNALAWQVTPNRKASLLFLKPLQTSATTNMTVVTNMRRYVFDLQVAATGPQRASAPYVVRFSYPPTAVALPLPELPEPPPHVANAEYAVTGSAVNAPTTVFDDGLRTYFAWAPNAPAPAIFAIGADGRESLVNHGVRGAYTVVDQLAPRFVLRNGKSVTYVLNRRYQAPAGPKLAARK